MSYFFGLLDGRKELPVQKESHDAGRLRARGLPLATGTGCATTSSPMARTALIFCLTLLTALASPVMSAPPVEIPFRFTDGFICIEARLDQTGEPLNFLLD